MLIDTLSDSFDSIGTLDTSRTTDDASIPVAAVAQPAPVAPLNSDVPYSTATAPAPELSPAVVASPSLNVNTVGSALSPSAPVQSLSPTSDAGSRPFNPANWPGWMFIIGDVAPVTIAATDPRATAWLWEVRDQNGNWSPSIKPGGGAPSTIMANQPPANFGIEWVDVPGSGVPGWAQRKYVDGVLSDEGRPNPARSTGDPQVDMAIYEHFITNGAADASIVMLMPGGVLTGAQQTQRSLALAAIAAAAAESAGKPAPAYVAPTGGPTIIDGVVNAPPAPPVSNPAALGAATPIAAPGVASPGAVSPSPARSVTGIGATDVGTPLGGSHVTATVAAPADAGSSGSSSLVKVGLFGALIYALARVFHL